MPTTRTIVLAFSSLALFIASVSPAQNALDPRARDSRGRPVGPARQGNALDSNLRVGSGGTNDQSVRENFAARNLIVTNSVAGGRGFRGSVGYTADTDFRGLTGSDSIYRFSADSALSAPTFIGATRPGDRFELAQQFGAFEYRRGSTPGPSPFIPSQVEGRIRLDQATSKLSTARLLERATEPQPFAMGRDTNERQVEFSASGALGMRMRRIDDPLDASAVSTFEKARARQDVADGSLAADAVVTTFQSPLLLAEQLRTDTRLEGQRVGAAQSRSSYDEVVKRLVEQFAGDPTVRIDANPQAIERARKELEELRGALRPTPTDKNQPVKPGTTPPPGESDPNKVKPAVPAESEPESADPETRRLQEEAKRRATVENAAKALRHGTRIGDLTPGERARVDELVGEGQRAIERGDFLRAERTFDQALTLNPDNPLLLAGLANSQLGGGLFLSAALTLRSLFADHPEMIDVRYEAKLLPNETRLRLAFDTLRQRIAQGSDADGYGLTLAYLGHQMSDRAMVEEGLLSLTGSMENDLLRDLLSEIWLGDQSSDAKKAPNEPVTPSPAPTPAPTPVAPSPAPASEPEKI